MLLRLLTCGIAIAAMVTTAFADFQIDKPVLGPGGSATAVTDNVVQGSTLATSGHYASCSGGVAPYTWYVDPADAGYVTFDTSPDPQNGATVRFIFDKGKAITPQYDFRPNTRGRDQTGRSDARLILDCDGISRSATWRWRVHHRRRRDQGRRSWRRSDVRPGTGPAQPQRDVLTDFRADPALQAMATDASQRIGGNVGSVGR